MVSISFKSWIACKFILQSQAHSRCLDMCGDAIPEDAIDRQRVGLGYRDPNRLVGKNGVRKSNCWRSRFLAASNPGLLSAWVA